ncbi:hypothetical protein [Sulfitobacter sp. DSM 110093]|uniref:peptidoglycan-binding domain-containing protein n=1 Tax=Sulfitobacter sp. DSM 110093 TaxID=2883127 RepID=UPI001FAD6294|nr:hypothetical protein [Sulfitobacter sp. DSM 110093]
MHLLLALCAPAAMADTAPCVSSTFDTPFPSAIDVVTRHADVPSPQFPGLWQEGTIRGFLYAMYANGEGYLKPSRERAGWEITFACPDQAQECATNTNGSPPAEAFAITNRLTSCLRGEVLTVSEPEPEPPQAAPAIDNTDPEPEAESPSPCSAEEIQGETEGMTLQMLLVEAGADPGPIDGFVGNKTRRALNEVLDSAADEMPLTNAIRAVRSALCLEAAE